MGLGDGLRDAAHTRRRPFAPSENQGNWNWMQRGVFTQPVIWRKEALMGSTFGFDITCWFGAFSGSTWNWAGGRSYRAKVFWTFASSCVSRCVRSQFSRLGKTRRR